MIIDWKSCECNKKKRILRVAASTIGLEEPPSKFPVGIVVKGKQYSVSFQKTGFQPIEPCTFYEPTPMAVKMVAGCIGWVLIILHG